MTIFGLEGCLSGGPFPSLVIEKLLEILHVIAPIFTIISWGISDNIETQREEEFHRLINHCI